MATQSNSEENMPTLGNQADTRIAESVVRQILSDYSQRLIEDLLQLVRDTNADLFSPAPVLARRTALLNAIKVIEDGGKYVKPYIIHGITALNDLAAPKLLANTDLANPQKLAQLKASTNKENK